MAGRPRGWMTARGPARTIMPKRQPRRHRDLDVDARWTFARLVAERLPDEDGAQQGDVALRAIGAVFWRWMDAWEKGHYDFFDPRSFIDEAASPSHAQRVFLDRRCQAIGTHPLPASVAAKFSEAVRETAAALTVEELILIRRPIMGLR